MSSRKFPQRICLVALGTLLAVAVFGSALASHASSSNDAVFAWALGARPTLATTVFVLVTSIGVGTAIGTAAALGPALVDALLSRAMEVVGSLPSLVIVVIVRALEPMPNLAAVGAVLALLRTIATAKIVRTVVLQLSTEDFVLAARALGTSRTRLFRVHLLPHVAGPVLTDAAFTAASVVSLDAALSFAGFETESSSWGSLIADAARRAAPAVAALPVLGVVATVAAFYLVADALDEHFRVGRRFV